MIAEAIILIGSGLIAAILIHFAHAAYVLANWDVHNPLSN